MIKKKLLYFSIITAILVAPIMYWLNKWWGVSLNEIPSFGTIRYVLSRDRFLFIVTCINLSLYVFAIARIVTLKGKTEENTQKKNSEKNIEKPSFLNNTTQADVAKWEALYGNNNQAKVEPKATENNPVNVTEKPLPQQNNVTKSQPQIQVRTEPTMPIPPKNEEVVTEKTSENNVVNMAGSVTALDVYKNMVGDILLDNGYDNLGAQVIANTDVDFVAIAESDTLILGSILMESGDMIANEISSGNDAPSWFTNERKFTSPVWEMKNVSSVVQNMINEVLPEDNGIVIKPIVVVPNATISNFDEIRSKWEEIGVDVVRFMNHSELPNLTDVLPDKQGTKVLESYKNFTLTLMKYFNQKARKTPTKKVG
ncbi:MAG: hypothetical protein IJ638_01015 [Alphaproteobacteria bacterium]|nr:hypothetical protein [Alphaproteobacteria bacterium]